ncbi:peptide chain release factor N(5)-glutamine methyltransferase [Amylibacter sp. SFDW26]|uniref:peptide chain release factor N(5)-glutamine methyltransferase n=1 Tax=Amylibacter sp. SFDW26 TaxID=2652722 RepID=UPI0012618267|nr:peptide chain release factor N(5)-glutamine methyltransferase [Amylibacter sp. SFDW26]KAB7615814.1 peptide chain release factor N(5)-glutamine methyltransferase [Amylibacter sp. SFDW26]
MTQTAQELLSWGLDQLTPVLGDTARTDARSLLAHAIGIERGMLSIQMLDSVGSDVIEQYKKMLAQRLQRQPVSQIIGVREFWGRRFIVTPDVLDPRPDTETLIEEILKEHAPKTILDLGTGSGCILLTLLSELPEATGVAVDLSQDALDVANDNANALDVKDRVKFVQSDWFQNIDGQFDLIVSNPPYITATAMDEIEPEVRDWEPRMALTPEGDGLDAYRIIASKAETYLSRNGHIFLEIGWDQAAAVMDIFKAKGFENGRCIQDLANKDRVLHFCAPKIA